MLDRLCALLVAVPMLVAAPAFAQDPPAEDGEEAQQNLISDSLTPKKGRLAARLTPFADGLVRDGAWAPLYVQMANGGDGFDLTLRATEMGEDYSTHTFERGVELPEGARKDAFLYVKMGRNSGVRSLRVDGDAERSGTVEYPVRMLAETDVGVAVLGEDLLGLVAVRDTWRYPVPAPEPRPHSTTSERRVHAGLVPYNAMPDRPAGYDAVNWVVWPEADPAEASGEALDALLGWVATGGHLFVTVSDGYARLDGTPLAEALPVRFVGVEDIDSPRALFQAMELPAPGEGPFPMARAEVVDRPDRHVEVLATLADSPVWTVGTYGLGTVHVLAMNPAQAPFTRTGEREAQWRSWLWLPEPTASSARVMFGTGQGYWDPTRSVPTYTGEEFWVLDSYGATTTERAAARVETLAAMDLLVDDVNCMHFQRMNHPVLSGHWDASERPEKSWEAALKQRLADIPGVAPLPLSWLMAFAGLYLFVIGPLDYFALRMIKRQPWTWITFPVTIVFFSAAALIGTTLTKGSQAVMTRIEVVDALPGTAFMRGTSWVGVFSTRKTEVGVKSSKGAGVTTPLGDGGFMSEVTVASGESSGGIEYLAQTWSLAYLQTDWVERADGGRVEVKVLPEVGWSVTSRLPVSLSHAVLRVDGRMVPIGKLAPDQSVTVKSTAYGYPDVTDDRTRFVLDAAGDLFEGGGGHLDGPMVVGVLSREYDGLELAGLWPQRDAITVYRIPVEIEP